MQKTDTVRFWAHRMHEGGQSQLAELLQAYALKEAFYDFMGSVQKIL